MNAPEYHKIQGLYKRHTDGPNKGKFKVGEFSLPEFDYLFMNEWEMTEKIDGTNIRIHWDAAAEKVTFGGRTKRSNIPAHLLEYLQDTFTPALFVTYEFADDITLYGEGCGPKIQKGGGNYGRIPNFVLFDVLCGNWWLRSNDVTHVAQSLGIDRARVVRWGNLNNGIELVSKGFNSCFGHFQAEGVVCRPTEQLFNRRGQRIITKLKCCDFQDQN